MTGRSDGLVSGSVRGLRWAVEDCRHLSARLEIDLLEAGEQVVRVPPKLMAEQRRLARTRGKSDPIDALAVARAALREPDLPTASHDERSRELRLLVDRREDLVAERTRMINRLRWHLHRIAPGEAAADPAPKTLNQLGVRRRLTDWLAGKPGIDARLAREVLADIDRICPQIAALERELTALIAAPGRGTVDRAARLRGVDRRQDHRGDGGCRAVYRRGQVRDARRCRSDPGLVRTNPGQGQG